MRLLALCLLLSAAACGGEDPVDGDGCTPTAELCDGLDNDCDGETDEGFELGSECSEGQGLCAASGQIACNDDGTASCNAVAGEPGEELCDGEDNDCDGETDEGFELGSECSEGQGLCAASGQIACNEDGTAACNAVAGEPGEELCDGEDNDCDGETDEGFELGSECSEGLGICAASGQIACNEDGTAACNAVAGEPGQETCDGLDNDCDGEVDEDYNVGSECAEGVGACAAAGQIVCAEDGSAACTAVAGEPSEETCDGQDNDCDGEADEGFDVGVECSEGVGACAAAGQIICAQDGTATCSAVAGEPREERCDTLDNDCDGEVDEGFDLGVECSEGVGACAAVGQIVCAQDGSSACNAVPGQPSDERCDAADNDCDGEVDEGFEVGSRCTEGLGQCEAEGQIACTQEGEAACDAVPGAPGEEICDQNDNDCDGEVDEGFNVGGECNLTLGACSNVGQLACAEDGSATCNGQTPVRAAETCDQLDNDCDGWVDERCDNPGLVAGVQQGTARADLEAEGWRVCYQSVWNTSGDTVSDILDDCDGSQLTMACGRTDSDNYLLHASGTRAGVTRTVANDRASRHQHNGATWYYNGAQSWGFAPANASVDRNTCDTLNGPNDDGDQRMCIHVSAATTNAGYRCGTMMSNVATDHKRVFLTRGTPQMMTRMIGGDAPGTGTLQAYVGDHWGYVCDDYFDNNAANVTCRQMGYAANGTHADANTGGSTDFTLDDVRCLGNEGNLRACQTTVNHNCAAHEAVELTCTGASRLQRSWGDNNETGLLQIFANGTWGPVCDDYFGGDMHGPDVVCRELGYPGARRQFDRNAGTNDFKLDNVRCTGSEHDLLDCPHNPINEENCSASEGVGIECLTWGSCRNDSHCDGIETCVNGTCTLP